MGSKVNPEVAKGLRQARGGINSEAVYAHRGEPSLDPRGREPLFPGGGQSLEARRRESGRGVSGTQDAEGMLG